MVRAILIALIMTGVVTTAAWAADFDEGCEAFDRGDFEQAMKEWEPLAEQGHPQAQFRLGCLYIFGQGVDTDYTRALELYQQAAAQGDPDAQNNLGSMYALGWGTEEDPVEAYKWLEVAARSGHEMATANRDFLGRQMSAAEIDEAVGRADAFLAGRATN